MTSVRYQALGPLLSGEGSRAFLGLMLPERAPARPIVLIWVPTDVAKDPEQSGALAKETLRASILEHPNIVRVYGLASLDEGVARIVEFADGETLRKVIETAGKLPPRLAGKIAADAAMGLHFAHLAGNDDGTPLVHGDLRPETLMVSFNGGVKVAGYGALSVAPRETGGKRVVHRRRYCAPEQIMGGRSATTLQSDVYLLGLVLYECLTGKMPFQGEPDFDQAVLSKPLPIDSADIPPELQSILVRATAKRAQDRHPSAHEFRQELEKALGPIASNDELMAHLEGYFPVGDPTRVERRRLLDSGIADWARRQATNQAERARGLGAPPPIPRPTTPPPHPAVSTPVTTPRAAVVSDPPGSGTVPQGPASAPAMAYVPSPQASSSPPPAAPHLSPPAAPMAEPPAAPPSASLQTSRPDPILTEGFAPAGATLQPSTPSDGVAPVPSAAGVPHAPVASPFSAQPAAPMADAFAPPVAPWSAQPPASPGVPHVPVASPFSAQPTAPMPDAFAPPVAPWNAQPPAWPGMPHAPVPSPLPEQPAAPMPDAFAPPVAPWNAQPPASPGVPHAPVAASPPAFAAPTSQAMYPPWNAAPTAPHGMPPAPVTAIPAQAAPPAPGMAYGSPAAPWTAPPQAYAPVPSSANAPLASAASVPPPTSRTVSTEVPLAPPTRNRAPKWPLAFAGGLAVGAGALFLMHGSAPQRPTAPAPMADVARSAPAAEGTPSPSAGPSMPASSGRGKAIAAAPSHPAAQPSAPEDRAAVEPPKPVKAATYSPPSQPRLELVVDPPVQARLDGKAIGRTPVIVPTRPGRHVVWLTDKSRGVDVRRIVEVSRNGTTSEHITLGAAYFSINVPNGAQVFLDGRMIANRSVKDYGILEGSHHVRVMLGSAKWEQSFDVAADEHMSYDVNQTAQ